MLEYKEAKVFIEGLFHLVKFARQTADHYLVIQGWDRLFTATHKSLATIRGNSMAHLDILLDLQDIKELPATLYKFYSLVWYKIPDISFGIYYIDIETYYQSFNNFISGKSAGGKSKVLWDHIRIQFKKHDTDNYYTGFQIQDLETTLFTTSLATDIVSDIPRIQKNNCTFHSLKMIYRPTYQYIATIIFEHTMLQEILASEMPLEVYITKNGCFLLGTVLESYTYEKLRQGFIMLSKNLFLKEVAKCERASCLMYQHTNYENRYIARFIYYYDGLIIASDTHMFIAANTV